MSQPTVLIISDQAEFAHTIVNRWQIERIVPAFTVMSSQLSAGASTAKYEVAIVGGVGTEAVRETLSRLTTGVPVILVATDASVAKAVHEGNPRVLVLRMHERWVDDLVLLASECLRRVEAQSRAEKAEARAKSEERDAILGRYMMEMRHGLNNALTSVLGNAELLLLEPGAMPPEMRDQVATIHNMALRIHEIVHRFSSLEIEMNFVEKESHGETVVKSQLFAAGS